MRDIVWNNIFSTTFLLSDNLVTYKQMKQAINSYNIIIFLYWNQLLTIGKDICKIKEFKEISVK